MRHPYAPLLAAAILCACAVVTYHPARAQQTPATLAAATPSPSPSPSPVPTPPAFTMTVDSYTSMTNQQMVGPGVLPFEGPSFSQGGALAPGTPYDMFSSGPLTTGQGISQDLILKPSFSIPNSKYDLRALIGYGAAGGNGNVVAYWGDSLYAPLNPHIGSNSMTVPPTFATHNGANPVTAVDFGVLQGSIVDRSGLDALTVGWFGAHQTVPFVFSQAPWTNTPFELAPQIAGSLGDGPPTVDVLKPGIDQLPLHGVDFWMKANLATIELWNADLPAPASAPARVNAASVVIDHGDGLSYSAELTHLSTSGADTARVLFGTNSSVTDGIPLSTVYGQQMTVFGAGAHFNVGTIAAEARYGFSCYSADGAAVPTSTCTAGNYYYGKVKHGFSKFELAFEGMRFEARYAPAILNYGTLENTWSYPAAWPSTWLSSSYQQVDNDEFSANRQGFRVSTEFLFAGVEARFAYASYFQIQALDNSSATVPGFVEPYFLPQFVASGTLGTEQQLTGWLNYPNRFANVTVDMSAVTIGRPAAAGLPQSYVAMEYPSIVVSLSRSFGPKIFGAAGWGRFGLEGQFDTSGPNNADLSQNLVFAGAEYRANANTGYGVQWRLYSTDGSPTIPGGPSPAFHGPQIQFYQRLKT